MLLHFDDAINLTGARLHRRDRLVLLYGIHHTLEFRCVAGSEHLPINIQEKGFNYWKLIIAKSLVTPYEELASAEYPTNIAINDTISFDFSTATQAMYRYMAGSRGTTGILELRGYNSQDSQEASLCIQIPLILRTTAVNPQPPCITDALLKEIQRATESASASAQESARHAQTIPVPSPDAAGMVPVVNPQGTAYMLADPAGGTARWGSILGDIHAQQDLQEALAQGQRTGSTRITGRLLPWLYGAYTDELDYQYAYEWLRTHDTSLQGGCSAVRSGMLFGRNFDWTYDDTVSFLVSTPAAPGRHAVIGMSHSLDWPSEDALETPDDRWRVMPFRLVDGINDAGLVVNDNVVPMSEGRPTATVPAVSLEDTVPVHMLVRFLLDRFSTAYDAASYVRDHCSVTMSSGLLEEGYDLHFMIADRQHTYLLEFEGSSSVVTCMDLGSGTNVAGRACMTNFRMYGVSFNEDGRLYTPADVDADPSRSPVTVNYVDPYGSGLERYNLIVDGLSAGTPVDEVMCSLAYTNAYRDDTNPAWWSEFAGTGGLTCGSPASAFEESELVALYKEAYRNRSRDPESPYYGTWQTCHTAVYDMASLSVTLWSQEDYSRPVTCALSDARSRYDLAVYEPENMHWTWTSEDPACPEDFLELANAYGAPKPVLTPDHGGGYNWGGIVFYNSDGSIRYICEVVHGARPDDTSVEFFFELSTQGVVAFTAVASRTSATRVTPVLLQGTRLATLADLHDTDASGTVRYDIPQDLTAVQRKQARRNIAPDADYTPDWNKLGTALDGLIINSLMEYEGMLIASTADHGVVKYSPTTGEWAQMGDGMDDRTVHPLEVINGRLHCGTLDVGVRFYDTSTDTWRPIGEILTDSILSLKGVDTAIYAGTFDHGVYKYELGEWTQTGQHDFINFPALSLVLFGGELYVGTGGGYGVRKLTDNAWESVGTGLDGYNALSLVIWDGTLVTGTNSTDGVVRLEGGTWSKLGDNADGLVGARLMVFGNDLYAATHDGVVRYVKETNLWEQVGTTLSRIPTGCLAEYSGGLVAGSSSDNFGGVYAMDNPGLYMLVIEDGVIKYKQQITQSQLVALNSGITAGKVAQYDGYSTSKADLTNGKVPSAQLPKAYKQGALSELGAVKVDNTYESGRYGLWVTTDGLLCLHKANKSRFDNPSERNHLLTGSKVTSPYGCIDTGNLDYAVRSVLPNVTALAADTASPIALTDASATTNNHSYHYVHEPDSAPIYTLPDVSDTGIMHEILLTVTFSASALSVAFQTTGGTTIPLDKQITPSAGDVWTFLCRYVSGGWRIYPVQEVSA